MSDVSRETSQLRAFEHLLATRGIKRGLVGPREAERLWPRHVLNCAVVAWDPDLVPHGAAVVDVGSGAGLPGIVWALARPDLSVTLVDSLQRRTTFLSEVVTELGLADRVTVERARAEALVPARWDVVTARAVAPLPRLLPWLVPLLRPGGVVLAFKGESAAAEVAEARAVAHRAGLQDGEILTVGAGVVDPPTTLVRYWSDTPAQHPGGGVPRP